MLEMQFTKFETRALTTQDMLISNYVSKTLRGKTVTTAENTAWNARQAELKSLREHSVNCYCTNCITAVVQR